MNRVDLSNRLADCTQKINGMFKTNSFFLRFWINLWRKYINGMMKLSFVFLNF